MAVAPVDAHLRAHVGVGSVGLRLDALAGVLPSDCQVHLSESTGEEEGKVATMYKITAILKGVDVLQHTQSFAAVGPVPNSRSYTSPAALGPAPFETCDCNNNNMFAPIKILSHSHARLLPPRTVLCLFFWRAGHLSMTHNHASPQPKSHNQTPQKPAYSGGGAHGLPGSPKPP